MILVVGQNLAWQKVCTLPHLLRGEVIRLGEVREFASSKGPNVARALEGTGCGARVIGYAGGATGRRVEEYLHAEGLDCRLVKIGKETRTCTTFVEPDGTSTEVIEPPPRVTSAEREEMQAAIRDGLDSARLLLIMGTAVDGETEDCYARAVRAAHDRGIPVVMDSAAPQAKRALEEGPEVLKINSLELGAMAGALTEAGTPPAAGATTRDAAARAAACRALSTRFGVRWLLITQGPEGIEAYGAGRVLHARPPRVKVLNAIGSGDAAAAGAGWVLHDRLGALGAAEVFASVEILQEAVLSAAAMGTANCMNPVNGKVERADYFSVRQRTTVEERTGPYLQITEQESESLR
jgi:fructose-1-phosphate kinase PfkB-like protein